MQIDIKNISLEKGLTLLKRKLQREGLFSELKKRRYYEKPSIKLKRKRIEAAKKRRKRLKRMNAKKY